MEQQRTASSTLRRLIGASLVAVALASLLLPEGDAQLLRGLAWGGAGLAKLAWSSRGREADTGWAWLATGNMLVAAGWVVAGLGTAPSLWHALVAAGLAVTVGGAVRATPVATAGTAVLDGLLIAVGILDAVVVVALGTGTVAPSLVLVPAVVAALAGLLLSAVMASLVAAGQLQPLPASRLVGVSTLSVTIAAAGTAVAWATGDMLSLVARVAWVVPPVTTTLVVLRGQELYRVRPERRRRSMVPARLWVLVGATLLPVVAALLFARAGLFLGCVASLAGALLLAARLVAAYRREIADERDAAVVRFDALVEHAGDVVALADADGMLFYVSRAVERMFGLDPTSLVGQPAVSVVVEQDRDRWAEALISAASWPGSPIEVAVGVEDDRGVLRHIECTVVDLCHLPGVGAVSMTVRDVSDRHRLEEELRHRARTDDLTGMVNRHVLTDRVQHVLRQREPRAALLYLDIDDFKAINDGHGHAAGDAVLVAISKRIDRALRPGDTAGRVGGDEFVVLLEGLDDPVVEADRIARRIRSLSNATVPVGRGIEVIPRLSIGAAIATPGQTSEELFAAADAAMYRAKRSGAGVGTFDEPLRLQTESRRTLLHDVGPVVAGGRFELHYQPIVHVASGRLDSVEALLRWHHVELGWVPPDEFLDQADAAGLTAELTEAVLRHVCVDLQRWHDETGTRIGVAINLSAAQLASLDAGRVLSTMALSGVPRDRMTFEVTETSMLGDVGAIAEVLQQFRDAGCHVAVDDFGTGHASIGYLRRLPVDHLKIDREFVDELTPDNAVFSFAATINRLAEDLGLRTVAEGIETQEQLDAVRALGCELAQGYLLGRPVPMSDLASGPWATAGLARGETVAPA